MKMHDLNSEKKEVILLLHPVFATADLMKLLLVEHLGNEYRYLIPDLAGHGEAKEQIYQSAELEAKAIYAYIQKENITQIKFAFGASLGAVVLMELLKIAKIDFGYLFFEGNSFVENAGVMGVATKSMVLNMHKKFIANPDIALEKMKQNYGEKAAKVMAEQIIALQKKSLENIIKDSSHVKLPKLSLEQQQKCIFAFGEKDGLLKAAKKVHASKYPKTKLIIWSGHNHCSKMTANPAKYSEWLKKYL